MKTHPLLHLAMALNVAVAFMQDNWFAAIAWATCWAMLIAYDYEMKRYARQMVAAKLFVDAHESKWPSPRAEKEASEQYAKFLRDSK